MVFLALGTRRMLCNRKVLGTEVVIEVCDAGVIFEEVFMKTLLLRRLLESEKGGTNVECTFSMGAVSTAEEVLE